MKIEFYALNPDYDASKPASDENSVYILSATHKQNDIDNGANSNKPLEFDLMATLSSGVRACLVRIISIEAKWGNGSATKMHEVSFDVHKCELTEDDYILEGDDYIAPKCGVDGSCMAVCQVCGVKQQTTIKATANNSHEFTSVIADQNPTCSEAGVGHAVCTKCSQTISGIIIPATKEHDYKVDKVLISAKCGFAGVRQLHCTYCDKVGAKFEIAPTGIHEYEWSTRSYASYTADGITAYACKHCDELDPNTEENTIVAEKLAIPEDILTFVSATKGDGSLTFTYKLKVDYFAEIQETCDIRVITTITDEQGRSASIESYGKYATNSYNEKTGEFSITIHPKNTSDEFEVNTVIRLMNFRGIVYKSCPNGSYEGTISMDDVQ